MGIILIIIAAIIQISLIRSSPNSDGYIKNASLFMINPVVRAALTILSWVLIIMGLVKLFS